MAKEELIPDKAWEEYAEIHEEATALPKKIELELWHHGQPTFIWSKIRKIARFEASEKVAAETWETMTERDTRQKFTVLLPKGETLATHVEYCKFIDTDFGSRLINRVVNTLLIGLNAVLILALFGAIETTPDFGKWYWGLTFGFVGGVISSIMIYNKIATCGRIVLECGDPDDETANHHVCYICHSKIMNVVEQLNFMHMLRPTFREAILGLKEELTNQRRLERDYIARLEHELDNIEEDQVHQVRRGVDRKLRLGGTVAVERQNLMMFAGIAIVMVVVGLGLGYYFFGLGG